MSQPLQTTLLKLNTTEMGKPFVVTASSAFELKRLNTTELGKIFAAPEKTSYQAGRMFLAF